MDGLRLPGEATRDGKESQFLKEGAKQLWSFLDDLVESDPNEYKSFMENQMMNMKSYLEKRPKSDIKHHFDVTTRKVLGLPMVEQKIVVRFSSSAKMVDAPKEADSVSDLRVPLRVGRNKKADMQPYSKGVVDWCVMFHPDVFDRARREENFRLFALDLAIRNVEQAAGYRLDRNFSIEKVSTNEPPFPKSDLGASSSAESEKPSGIMLPFASKLTLRDESRAKSQEKSAQTAAVPKKILVEEVKQTPKYTLTRSESQPASFIIRFELPEIETTSELELDISAIELKLNSSVYEIEMRFPSPIVDSKVTAKFDKRSRRLRLHLPIAP